MDGDPTRLDSRSGSGMTVWRWQTGMGSKAVTPIPASSAGQALTFPHQGGREIADGQRERSLRLGGIGRFANRPYRERSGCKAGRLWILRLRLRMTGGVLRMTVVRRL